MSINAYLKKTKELLYFGEVSFLKTPIEIYLEISNVCNLQCTYCYKTNLNKGFPKTMDVELVKKIVSDVKKMTSLPVLFILEGGEPFLHKKIIEIIKIIKEAGYPIDILSNGLKISVDVMEQLQKNLDNNIDEIQISLDSLSICGNKHRTIHTKYIIETIQLLNSYDIIPRINTVITKDNAIDIMEFIENIDSKLLIKSLSLNSVIGKSNVDIRLSLSERKKISELIKTINTTFDIYESIKHLHCDSMICNMKNDRSKNEYYKRCTALTSKVCISTDGRIFPCVFYENRIQEIGNINIQSLEEIWQSDNAKKFRNKRNEELLQCVYCNNNKYCTQLCVGGTI